MYIKFQKIEKQKKSLDLVDQKLVKLNKLEKTEELIAQYQEVVSLRNVWNVLSIIQRQKLTANGLNKPKQKV